MPALTMLKDGVSIAHIAADFHVSKRAISDLNKPQQGFQTTPCQPEKREQGRRRGPLMELMQ